MRLFNPTLTPNFQKEIQTKFLYILAISKDGCEGMKHKPRNPFTPLCSFLGSLACWFSTWRSFIITYWTSHPPRGNRHKRRLTQVLSSLDVLLRPICEGRLWPRMGSRFTLNRIDLRWSLQYHWGLSRIGWNWLISIGYQVQTLKDRASWDDRSQRH